MSWEEWDADYRLYELSYSLATTAATSTTTALMLQVNYPDTSVLLSGLDKYALYRISVRGIHRHTGEWTNFSDPVEERTLDDSKCNLKDPPTVQVLGLWLKLCA